MPEVKVFAAELKAVDEAKGIVTALVSVTGNVDVQGDRVMPGAFDRTIADWRGKMARGQFLPVIYGHKDDPDHLIGKVLDLRATEAGLEVDEQFFLDKPKARSAFHAIREGILPGSSFGYGTRKAKTVEGGVRNLLELDLYEVGPTAYPANDATMVLGVKDSLATAYTVTEELASDGDGTDRTIAEAFASKLGEMFRDAVTETKVGRAISAKNESDLREAVTLITGVLDTVAANAEADAASAVSGKAEEPEANAEPEVDPERQPALAAARAMFG